MERLRILVLNPGSSSLKASLIELPERTIARAEVPWDADASQAAERGKGITEVLRALDTDLTDLDAVGYRVVHGGIRFTASTRIDDAVLDGIRDTINLAPLHNRVALETILAGRERWPGLPHVALFDTAFHASLAPEAARYAVPGSWFTEYGIRRYGFHGLSVAWSTRRAAEMLRRDAGGLRVVVAHLGGGCSVTAVDKGSSVDTSMGMTPLEGLMMSTRSGSIDPGVLLWLLEEGRRTPAQLTEDLEHASGLLGVSGVSGHMREVEVASEAGNERASLAVAMFVHRAAAAIGASATTLPVVDAIVFTGGIGEHAAAVRAAIAARLAVVGVAPLPLTQLSQGDRVLSEDGARVAVLVIEAREDLVIAAETGAVLAR